MIKDLEKVRQEFLAFAKETASPELTEQELNDSVDRLMQIYIKYNCKGGQ